MPGSSESVKCRARRQGWKRKGFNRIGGMGNAQTEYRYHFGSLPSDTQDHLRFLDGQVVSDAKPEKDVLARDVVDSLADAMKDLLPPDALPFVTTALVVTALARVLGDKFSEVVLKNMRPVPFAGEE
ncbi:MAG: hypothetical protein HQL90_04125 [Magnetococcales bacterium]|nr:hypothetical protein [Magnetococcales bacterium]